MNVDHLAPNLGRLEHNFSKLSSNSRTPITKTSSPIVTGTSVLGIKYKDGVMIIADCLASYGSLARFRDVQRVNQINKQTIIGSTGDISDQQYLLQVLERQEIKEYCEFDGLTLKPNQIFESLINLMYQRRTKGDPLWNYHVIGGIDNGKKFLGYVDLLGTRYQSSTIATGYGAYIAQPLLRKAVEGKEDTLTEQEAIKILDDAMRVLYYRDARSLNKMQRATVTEAGVKITEPYELETEWGFAENVQGYK